MLAFDVYAFSGLIVAIIAAAATVGAVFAKIAAYRDTKQEKQERAAEQEKDQITQMVMAFSDQPETPFQPARDGVLRRLSRVESAIEELKRTDA